MALYNFFFSFGDMFCCIKCMIGKVTFKISLRNLKRCFISVEVQVNKMFIRISHQAACSVFQWYVLLIFFQIRYFSLKKSSKY